MAIDVLSRYGIKEVADVTFYQLIDGKPAYPVLYCDTLKVSTIEQTADEATANGGKGNVALISWDYNKDINVTIEDALFSAKSMAILFGNGKAHEFTNGLVMRTEQFKATATGNAAAAGWKDKFEGPDGKLYAKINPKFYSATEGETESAANVTNLTTFEEGKTYFCSYDLLADGAAIKIGASTFPGTYYVVGDTFARSQADGKDEFFQFIISKAKITSENTITMEADGDPSVFNMNLHVLRPESGDMMKLVKYELLDGADPTEETLEIYHNHVLGIPNAGDETVVTANITVITAVETDTAVTTADGPIVPAETATITFDKAGFTASTFTGHDGLTIEAADDVENNTEANFVLDSNGTTYKGKIVVALA